MVSAVRHLTSLDFLAYNHFIRFKGSEKFKTSIGGVLSIFLTMLFGLGIFYFSRDMVYKRNPIVVQSTQIIKDSDVSLKEIGFFFFLVNRSGENYTLNPKYMKALNFTAMSIDFNLVNKKITPVYKLLFIERCQSSFFTPEIASLYSQAYNLEEFLCINPNKYLLEGKVVEEEIKLKGNWSDPGGTSFWLNVKICDERKWPGCRDIIYDNKDPLFVANLADYFFDPIDSNNPIQPNYKVINTHLSPKIGLQQKVTMKATNVVLDSAFIFESTDTKTFYSFGISEMSMQIIEGEELDMFDFMISRPNAETFFYRRYIKLQEIIAQVGGFIKAGMIVFGSLSRFVGEFKFVQSFKSEEDSQEKKVSFTTTRNNSKIDLKPAENKGFIDFWTFCKAKLFLSKESSIYLRYDEIEEKFDLYSIDRKLKKISSKLPFDCNGA